MSKRLDKINEIHRHCHIFREHRKVENIHWMERLNMLTNIERNVYGKRFRRKHFSVYWRQTHCQWRRFLRLTYVWEIFKKMNKDDSIKSPFQTVGLSIIIKYISGRREVKNNIAFRSEYCHWTTSFPWLWLQCSPTNASTVKHRWHFCNGLTLQWKQLNLWSLTNLRWHIRKTICNWRVYW